VQFGQQLLGRRAAARGQANLPAVRQQGGRHGARGTARAQNQGQAGRLRAGQTAEIGPKAGRVGVIAQQAAAFHVQGVDRPQALRQRGQPVQVGQDGLLVRDGHVQPVQLAGPQTGSQFGQSPRLGRIGRVELVFAGQARGGQGGGVPARREAVAERIAGQSQAEKGPLSQAPAPRSGARPTGAGRR